LQTNVDKLSEALSLLRAFHDSQPKHEAITINFELGSNRDWKGNVSEFNDFQRPEDLDDLIRKHLGDALFTPRDLLLLNNENPVSGSLHRAVTPKTPGGPSGWPTTDALRGKFIFIAHGDDDEANNRGDLNRYFGPDLATINNRVCFMLDENRWKSWSLDEMFDKTPYVIFHGEGEFVKGKQQNRRQELPGHILRSRQVEDGPDKEEYANLRIAQSAGANFIFMDIVHTPDAPFRVYNDHLYPFGASVPKPDGTYPVGNEVWKHPLVVNKVEPGNHFRFADRSGGDLDKGRDKFSFAFSNLPGQPSVTESWIVEIASVSNRERHPHGKGFIMARESLDDNASYFAVGRTADRYGLRIQYRIGRGNGTTFEEYKKFITNPYTENYNFVKLEISSIDGGRSTVCRGFGSATGRDGNWEQIDREIVFHNIALPLKGLATCSNSGRNVDNSKGYSSGIYSTFDFVNLRRQIAGRTAEPVDLNIFQIQKIGHNDEPLVLRNQP
jgi:hypothetical protein